MNGEVASEPVAKDNQVIRVCSSKVSAGTGGTTSQLQDDSTNSKPLAAEETGLLSEMTELFPDLKDVPDCLHKTTVQKTSMTNIKSMDKVN